MNICYFFQLSIQPSILEGRGVSTEESLPESLYRRVSTGESPPKSLYRRVSTEESLPRRLAERYSRWPFLMPTLRRRPAELAFHIYRLGIVNTAGPMDGGAASI